MIINDIWHLHNFIGMIVAAFVLCLSFRKAFGLLAVTLWFYVLCSLIISFQSPWNDNNLQYRFDASSANGAVFALLIPMAAYLLNNKYKEWVFDCLLCICIVDCCLIYYFGYGIFNAYSFDCAMMAMMYPALFWRTMKQPKIKILAGVFILATIIIKGKSTGSFALIAATLSYFTFDIWFGFIAAAMILGAAYWANGNLLFSDSARIENWSVFMGWWAENINPWFGTMFGRAEWLLPYLSPHKQSVFLQMHNEYLQVLFEGGCLGFALMLALFGQMAHLAYQSGNRWKLATIASTCTVCLTQFPFRFALSAFFICFVAVIIFSERDNQGVPDSR